MTLVEPTRLSHFNGTAASSAATPNHTKVPFAALAVHLTVRNLDGANDLNVSFDGGKTYFAVDANQTLQVSCRCHEVHVSGVGAPVDYNMLVGLR